MIPPSAPPVAKPWTALASADPNVSKPPPSVPRLVVASVAVLPNRDSAASAVPSRDG